MDAGLEYPPEESEGASWDIMSPHAEFQAVRTVATRIPGGRDWPHSNFVTELSNDEDVKFELVLSLLSDILRLRRMSLREALGGGFTRRREEEEEEQLVHDDIVFEQGPYERRCF